MAYSEFNSVCVDVEDFKYPKKNNMDWKNIRFSASTSTNLLEGPFSPATLTLLTWCHLPLILWKTLLHRKKRKGKRSSCKLNQQYEGTLHSSLNVLIIVEFTESTSKRTTSKMIPITSQRSFYKCKKKSTNWFARSLLELFQNKISLWIRQYKVRYQPEQG